MKILVLNGPNLNMLGKRDPDMYGSGTLGEVNARIKELAAELGAEVYFHQSNHEGDLVDIIQDACDKFGAIVFNPGAYTHYSLALRDAVADAGIPVVEVHISNIYSREEFRRISVIAPVSAGQITGLGTDGYLLGFRAAVSLAGRREL